MEIVAATAADAAAISRIHAAGWKFAYRGMVPQDYLDALRDDHWEQLFAGSLADGVQVVNSSLVDPALVDPARRSVLIPVNDLAHELGNVKLANMVALGAWLKATGALPLAVVQEALNRVVSAHYAKLIPVNARALETGYGFA